MQKKINKFKSVLYVLVLGIGSITPALGQIGTATASVKATIISPAEVELKDTGKIHYYQVAPNLMISYRVEPTVLQSKDNFNVICRDCDAYREGDKVYIYARKIECEIILMYE